MPNKRKIDNPVRLFGDCAQDTLPRLRMLLAGRLISWLVVIVVAVVVVVVVVVVVATVVVVVVVVACVLG